MNTILDSDYGIRLQIDGTLIDVRRLNDGELYAEPVVAHNVPIMKIALARKTFVALEKAAARPRKLS
jgi:hypothetical protein